MACGLTSDSAQSWRKKKEKKKGDPCRFVRLAFISSFGQVLLRIILRTIPYLIDIILVYRTMDPDALNVSNEAGNGRNQVSADAPEIKNYWAEDGVFSPLSQGYREDLDVKAEYMREYWKAQSEEVKAIDFPRPQLLPPKRIRRIIKSDEDVVVCFASFESLFSYSCYTYSFTSSTALYTACRQGSC
jgi:hypothetical protein